MRASTSERGGTTALQRRTFRRGSRTYHTSSLFFPPEVRRDVTCLYTFVRVADDYVDSVPQNAVGLAELTRRYRASDAEDPVVGPFLELARRKRFETEWTEAFLHSMQLDLSKHTYRTIEETLEYIYGSAEVIGLFMARIMDLPEASFASARLLGRAMQYINFIRDIDGDRRLGRSYLPWDGPSAPPTDPVYARRHAEDFRRFVRHHIALYLGWQRQAEDGYRFIPHRYLVPIKTASDMYRWTAAKLEHDPFLVFQRCVKPGRTRIILHILENALRRAGAR